MSVLMLENFASSIEPGSTCDATPVELIYIREGSYNHPMRLSKAMQNPTYGSQNVSVSPAGRPNTVLEWFDLTDATRDGFVFIRMDISTTCQFAFTARNSGDNNLTSTYPYDYFNIPPRGVLKIDRLLGIAHVITEGGVQTRLGCTPDTQRLLKGDVFSISVRGSTHVLLTGVVVTQVERDGTGIIPLGVTVHNLEMTPMYTGGSNPSVSARVKPTGGKSLCTKIWAADQTVEGHQLMLIQQGVPISPNPFEDKHMPDYAQSEWFLPPTDQSTLYTLKSVEDISTGI